MFNSALKNTVMAINLQKGQREIINDQQFVIGLGWDPNNAANGNSFDLDASVFILGANKKLLTDQHFVFYNNLVSPDGAVTHAGDNLTGQGEGDDEQVKVVLSGIDKDVQEMSIVVTIHEAQNRKQNFGQIRNSYVRVFNPDTGEDILKYELEEDFSIETAVEFGRIYRKGNDWKFEAVGIGMKGGLEEFLNMYS